MLKKIELFLVGVCTGMLAMGGIVYYLRYHLAMNAMPWIMVAAALVLVLLCVIAYLSQRHQVVRLQKQAAKAAAASTPVSASASDQNPDPARH